MPQIDTWRGPKKPEGIRAFIGWNGLMVNDPSINILDLLRAFYHKAAQESCGQCAPCRSGLKKIAAALGRICEGQSQDGDRESLAALAALVKDSARCDIGQTTPVPLLDMLEKNPALFQNKDRVAPGDYVATVTAPCINACPSHVNIPDYIEKIRARDFGLALETVLKDCPMPGTIGRVCVRPCEQNCRRALVDQPLAIKTLKRFAADDDIKKNPVHQAKKISADAPMVAIAGAGPAGVSCGYYLAKNGFAVTIFEAQETGGGMARYGIPDYRLPQDVLTREVDRAAKEGCDIKYGVAIGRDLTVADLEARGFEAVFIGTGAPGSASMYCEGEDQNYQGFVPGVTFLAESARGNKIVSGQKAVIIGGGNVAMDCVRTALRQGIKDVHLLYRRTIEEMPADHVEIEESQEEGVIFNFLVAPVKILAKDGRVTGILCQKMELGEPDASGRRSPVPVPGGEFEIPCDIIIPAIGQTPNVDVVLKGVDGCLSKRNTIVADSITGLSEKDGLFGGGDCLTGPSSLISALAAGKRAAAHIMDYINKKPVEATQKEKLEAVIAKMGVFDPNEQWPYKSSESRLTLKATAPEERVKNFNEVESGATAAEAANEASRCLRCFRLAMAAL